MGKEAYDDYLRYRRDVEANAQMYSQLTKKGYKDIPSSQLKVGDLIRLKKDEKVPADCILLRSTDANGTCFIRTDQLDGETDWKLRIPLSTTQNFANDDQIFEKVGSVYAEAPHKNIESFIGNITWINNRGSKIDPISIENTLWMNTVVASDSVLCLVIYTGKDTKAVMNTNFPSTKTGLVDYEINNLSKVFLFTYKGIICCDLLDFSCNGGFKRQNMVGIYAEVHDHILFDHPD